MNAKGLIRLFHTVKYLRFKQVYYRLYYAVFAKLRAHTIQEICCNTRIWTKVWSSPRPLPSPFISATELHFLGERGHVQCAHDWNAPHRSKLWLYNLHYFDALNANEADTHTNDLQELINRWTQDNPPCEGIGWEPYPLSLRLVNLVKWYSRKAAYVTSSVLASLAQQTQALSKQIEYHILGNHLFANGKALVFSGAYLSGLHADRWLKQGLTILDKEIQEQFLADGGHFELSPMYHATLLWDMCDLVNLAQCSGLVELTQRQTQWQAIIVRGLAWLDTMLHPDQKISFFNDAAFGIAPEYADIAKYALQLGIKTHHQKKDGLSYDWLPHSGYCAVNLGEKSKLLVDMAHIGPNYQPGHAHADTLSFEMSVYGQRLFVNSGTSVYAEGALREYERSTSAHNTLSIHQENSSEVWAAFRVARRAYPKNCVIKWDNDELISIAASHNGYKRLPGRNMHRRAWMVSSQKLLLRDVVTGTFREAKARFYFHPDVSVDIVGDGLVTCRLTNAQEVLIKIEGFNQLKLDDTFWSPQFGVRQPNKCLVIDMKARELLTEITW